MFEAFIKRCVVCDDLSIEGENLRYEFHKYHLGRRAIKARLVLPLLIRFVMSREGAAGHFVVGWLLAREKWQNGGASTNVADHG